MIWVAVGGRGTLVGAIVGALLVNFGKTWFTSGLLAEYWLFVLGALFIAVTLFLPKGVVGTLLARRRGSAGRASPPPLAPIEAGRAAEEGA